MANSSNGHLIARLTAIECSHHTHTHTLGISIPRLSSADDGDTRQKSPAWPSSSTSTGTSLWVVWEVLSTATRFITCSHRLASPSVGRPKHLSDLLEPIVTKGHENTNSGTKPPEFAHTSSISRWRDPRKPIEQIFDADFSTFTHSSLGLILPQCRGSSSRRKHSQYM